MLRSEQNATFQHFFYVRIDKGNVRLYISYRK